MLKWKVAYVIESGISQNGKRHIPVRKVAYAKMESGIYQLEKWHIQILSVKYIKFICDGN
jgi:hypothetical protein